MVVGGGRVAERKVLSLIEYGARVTVVSPELTPKLSRFAKRGRIRTFSRPVRVRDLKGQFVIICATSNQALNARIGRRAIAKGQLVNVVDAPSVSNFIAPSVVRRGALVIAISTEGQVPALSKRLRKDIERTIGPRYTEIVRFLARLRKGLQDEVEDIRVRRQLMNQIVDRDFHLLANRAKRSVLEKRIKRLIRKFTKDIKG